MLWDLQKARAHKRKQRLRLERGQKLRDFIDNMKLAQEFYVHLMDDEVVYDRFFDKMATLPLKFMQWAFSKYRHDKYKEPLSQEHMDMEETWRLIVLAREACHNVIEMREEVKRLEMHHKAVHALCMHKMHKFMMRYAR